ncbi:hypothetical protein DPMN_041004 [Dreissena polymorpha]|uniref:Uncharacterized protein n=1 Tax=Dreissena polymorpha TaxID=45954 RepID=A0A9D4CX19_DREPO|nr:hypothetical protein DPMN_041004 [Dreissena polymorpha]
MLLAKCSEADASAEDDAFRIDNNDSTGDSGVVNSDVDVTGIGADIVRCYVVDGSGDIDVNGGDAYFGDFYSDFSSDMKLEAVALTPLVLILMMFLMLLMLTVMMKI